MMRRHSIGAAIVALTLLSLSCAKRENGRRVADNQTSSNSSAVSAVEITTQSGIEMVLVPGGEFTMGSTKSSPDEGPLHKVMVSEFAMDKFEVTQRQFALLELPDPSQFKDDSGKRPVEQIRWSDAAKYCNERSRREGLEPCYDEEDLEFKCDFEASGYRLPTEAEWEYTARAGTETVYDFGSSPRQLKNYACYAGNSRKKTDPVGRKKANRWGLYDMYGNVSEWCHDRYSDSYYRNSPVENPRGPTEGKKRVLRGGSWKLSESACRATIRFSDVPGYADACFARNTYGFRCVQRLSPEKFKLLKDANPDVRIAKP